MKPVLIAVAFALAMGSSASSCFASATVLAARVPVGVSYGWGETIAHVMDLPNDVRNGLKLVMNRDLAIGYSYSRFFLFAESAEFWTWGGKFVLYQGNNYWPMTNEELEKLVGKETVDSLSRPWNYLFPPGMIGIVVLVVIVLAIARFNARTQAQLRLHQQRYQEALGCYARCFDGEHEPDSGAKNAGLRDAVDHLANQYGMDRGEAEQHLRSMIREIERDRSWEWRNAAASHEEAREWESAAEGYARAAEIMDLWDPADAGFLRTCIDRVRKKAASSSEAAPNDLPS